MSLLSCQIAVALEALQIESLCLQQDPSSLLILLQVCDCLRTEQEQLYERMGLGCVWAKK